MNFCLFHFNSFLQVHFLKKIISTEFFLLQYATVMSIKRLLWIESLTFRFEFWQLYFVHNTYVLFKVRFRSYFGFIHNIHVCQFPKFGFDKIRVLSIEMYVKVIRSNQSSIYMYSIKTSGMNFR